MFMPCRYGLTWQHHQGVDLMNIRVTISVHMSFSWFIFKLDGRKAPREICHMAECHPTTIMEDFLL